MAPWSQYSQPKILDQTFGLVVGCVRTGITIGSAATTINTGSAATGGVSGNMDATPANNSLILICTPGTGATQNQYSAISAYKVSSSTATAMTLPASTVASAAISVGDFIVVIGTTSTQNPVLLNNTLYVGMSTAGAQTAVTAGSDLATLPTATINVTSTTGFAASGTILVDSSNGLQSVAYTGVTGTSFTTCTGGTGTIDTTSTVIQMPTSASLLSGEPSSTGSYARVAQLNTPGNYAAATGTAPASKTNVGAITFPASTAAFSSGATALSLAFWSDAPTLGGGNVIAWALMNPAQTVNASGITVSFAASALTLTQL